MRKLKQLLMPMGVLAISALFAATILAQSAPRIEKDWHKVTHDGRSTIVWGWRNAEGRISWFPDEQPADPPQLLPARPKPAPTPGGFEVNGVKPERLADNGPNYLRASDPATYQAAKATIQAMAAEQAIEKPKCPEPKPPEPDQSGPIEGPLKRIEERAQDAAHYLVAGILAFLAVVCLGVAAVARPNQKE